jgi:hypothetical protein
VIVKPANQEWAIRLHDLMGELSQAQAYAGYLINSQANRRMKTEVEIFGGYLFSLSELTHAHHQVNTF